jgi:predicted deacylase
LTFHGFGNPGARPPVYIQAALHADEIPGMICALELRRALTALEARGEIAGEIILVPVANPIGLGQEVLGTPLGRFDFADGCNFNRGFPALGADLAETLRTRLGPDAEANVATVREALAQRLADQPALTAAAHLKKALMALALPCDLVLDLHCDAEASVHLYTHAGSAATFAPLAARLGSKAVLVAENSGGDPFDEALSRPWFELAKARPEHPIPFSCQSVTVELRGQNDVSPEFARADAEAILGFLRDRAVLAGPVPPLPRPLCEATPLAASEPLVAPGSGILIYRKPVGQVVEAGEILAEIIDPISGASTPILSPCEGMFFARSGLRFVHPGRRLGKVAGKVARRAGYLLSP